MTPIRSGWLWKEHMRSRPDVRSLVRAYCAKMPGFVVRIGVPERLTTLTGEQAVIVRIDGELDGAPVRHEVGFVLLREDLHTLVAGVVLDPGAGERFAAAVRRLVIRGAPRVD
jgi:hypothetical protein